jgi:hypothetical protein
LKPIFQILLKMAMVAAVMAFYVFFPQLLVEHMILSSLHYYNNVSGVTHFEVSSSQLSHFWDYFTCQEQPQNILDNDSHSLSLQLSHFFLCDYLQNKCVDNEICCNT